MYEMHDNAGHSNWRRLLATVLKRFWWRGVAADCKAYCMKCIECDLSKPHRRGQAPVHPLLVPQYPWEVVGVDFVTSLPKSGKEGYTAVMILIDHLSRMAHFIPTYDEVTAEQSADMFVHHCYRLHGCPKVLVSDRDPIFVSEFWQSLWRKLNTKLNMSTARRPQTDGLTERVNETMQSLLRCYCAEAGYDWSDQLDMIEFQYNSFQSDATRHSPFETYYKFQPAAHVDRMLPLDDAEPAAADRLTKIAYTQAVVKELLKLSKERQAARRTSYTPSFEPGDKVYLSTKGLNIKSHACHKLKDRFIGPYQVLKVVGKTSYQLQDDDPQRTTLQGAELPYTYINDCYDRGDCFYRGAAWIFRSFLDMLILLELIFHSFCGTGLEQSFSKLISRTRAIHRIMVICFGIRKH